MESKQPAAPPVAAIAQYWNQPCSYIGLNLDLEYEPMVGVVNEWRFLEMKEYRNFQLHLKSMHLLTDDQLRVIAGLLGCNPSKSEIVRREDVITLKWRMQRRDYQFEVWYHGVLSFNDDELGETLFNQEPIIAYCKAQGYYWPQSVPEEFVKLLTE